MAKKTKKSSTKRELYTKVVGKTGITFRKVKVSASSGTKKRKKTKK